ncbi:uncharacterized protein LOC112184771 [Rosa chinensis]|uniref:uncharacterized protein LOC112184771 n=1 Tax=Rosa chinensis TaxID=74649 RepID=UPI000D09684A|nr:uncharacterized protein LOC112184771 [Rosa chinensis]
MDRRLKALYFTSPCRFQGDVFHRRYRMRPHVFDQMMHNVANHDPYFVQTDDASGKVGLSTEQKLTCAMRILGYKLPTDLCDEFLDVAESTALEILLHFTRAIWNVYHKHYLRRPTPADFATVARCDREHGQCYYLVDEIYPKWGSFVKAIRNPIMPEQAHFTKMQESYRKDVEKAFGILQARFAIVSGPARGWDREDLQYIMMTYIILHNMIVDDEPEEDKESPIDPDDIPTKPRKAQIYERYEDDHEVEHNHPELEEFMTHY